MCGFHIDTILRWALTDAEVAHDVPILLSALLRIVHESVWSLHVNVEYALLTRL